MPQFITIRNFFDKLDKEKRRVCIGSINGVSQKKRKTNGQHRENKRLNLFHQRELRVLKLKKNTNSDSYQKGFNQLYSQKKKKPPGASASVARCPNITCRAGSGRGPPDQRKSGCRARAGQASTRPGGRSGSCAEFPTGCRLPHRAGRRP